MLGFGCSYTHPLFKYSAMSYYDSVLLCARHCAEAEDQTINQALWLLWRSLSGQSQPHADSTGTLHEMCTYYMKKGNLGEETQSWGLSQGRDGLSRHTWQGRGSLQAKAVSTPLPCHCCTATAWGMRNDCANHSSPAATLEAGNITLAATMKRYILHWLFQVWEV